MTDQTPTSLTPDGAPIPPSSPLGIRASTLLITLIVGTAAAFLLLGINARPTRPARHSTHLQSQQQHTPSPDAQSDSPQPQLAPEPSHD